MAATKYSVSAYTADGVTTDYLITWDYLDNDHIAVYVDGTANYDPTSTYTFELLNSTTVRVTDEFGNAVPAGAEIEVRRETPINTRAVTFNDGSALLAEDLNKNSDYLLYSMQEVLDTVEAAAQDGALAAQVATEELRDQTEVLRATTEGYKNETLTARNTTQTYLATVDADATAADNHRIAAAASEAAALASKNAAAASQAASATSEANAAASEAASAASEAAAAVSEANALASQNAAATSEANAAASETAAQTAQAAAEAALDELTDLYLGAKTAAPTVDNDGNALQTGALYWNSTNDTMYVWSGSAWDTFNSSPGIADSATNQTLFITSNGNVGIGTGSSAVKFEVEADSGASDGSVSAPVAIRITDTLSSQSGTTDTTNPWGALQFYSRDTSNEGPIVQAQISAIYDDVYAAGSHLAFSTWDAGNATPIERMRLESSGNLFVAKTSSSSHTVGCELLSSGLGIFTRDGNVPLLVNRKTSDGNIVEFRKDGTSVGSISVTSSGTTFTTTSDRRLKTDIQPIADATSKLMAMKPVTHKWVSDPDADAVVGFIAQEMLEVVPEAVSGTPDGDAMMSMDYGRITPVLVAALQEAHKKIEMLEKRLTEMENE